MSATSSSSASVHTVDTTFPTRPMSLLSTLSRSSSQAPLVSSETKATTPRKSKRSAWRNVDRLPGETTPLGLFASRGLSSPKPRPSRSSSSLGPIAEEKRQVKGTTPLNLMEAREIDWQGMKAKMLTWRGHARSARANN